MMDSSLNPQGLRGWAEWAYCQGKVEGVAVAGHKPLPGRAYPLYTVMLKNGELLGHASFSTPLAKRTDPSQSGGKREVECGVPSVLVAEESQGTTSRWPTLVGGEVEAGMRPDLKALGLSGKRKGKRKKHCKK